MRPREIVHLEPACFGHPISGEGPQLVAILQCVNDLLPDLLWYVADVDANGRFPIPRQDPTPVRFGDTRTLAEAAQQIVQFESGVFAGVPSSVSQPVFREGGLWTEDEDTADLGDAVVELRAYDAAYWFVATIDPDIAKGICRRLDVRASD